jgi:betaine reductase
MAKEIERAGIPCSLVSALYSLALTTGAPRVIRGSRIEHVCGDAKLAPDADLEYRTRIVQMALDATTTPVSEPTLFDPDDRSVAPVALVGAGV